MRSRIITLGILFVVMPKSGEQSSCGAGEVELQRELAQQVHRDEWGVPHIFGKTDMATTFGMGYAQAEDYFDQAQLVSERKFKDAWFYDDDVKAHATRSYHPGESLN